MDVCERLRASGDVWVGIWTVGVVLGIYYDVMFVFVAVGSHCGVGLMDAYADSP